jgi:hypothetical protein
MMIEAIARGILNFLCGHGTPCILASQGSSKDRDVTQITPNSCIRIDRGEIYAVPGKKEVRGILSDDSLLFT